MRVAIRILVPGALLVVLAAAKVSAYGAAELQPEERVLPLMLTDERSRTDQLGDLVLTPGLSRLTSAYGPRWGRPHRGVDWAAPQRTEIRALRPGVVRWALFRRGYGRLVIVDHGGGLRTWYAHASRILVSRGQRVQRGQPLALVGHSGYATGPHLHFEIRIDGETIDPLPFLWLEMHGVAGAD